MTPIHLSVLDVSVETNSSSPCIHEHPTQISIYSRSFASFAGNLFFAGPCLMPAIES